MFLWQAAGQNFHKSKIPAEWFRSYSTFFLVVFFFLTNARNESPNYCTSIKKYYKIVNSLEILDYCLVRLACCVTVPRLYILGRLPVTRGLQYFTQMAIYAKQGCRIRLEGNWRKKATDRQWTFFFLILSAIALFIYIYVNIESPDERVITKQACKNESIFSLFFSYLKNIYMYLKTPSIVQSAISFQKISISLLSHSYITRNW